VLGLQFAPALTVWARAVPTDSLLIPTETRASGSVITVALCKLDQIEDSLA
jgi:hypothetical protein